MTAAAAPLFHVPSPPVREVAASDTQTGTTFENDWLTPPRIIEALGPFDLDPAAPTNRPWATAARHLTEADDGLKADWPTNTFVWCSPPYTRLAAWLERCATHNGPVLALVHARTESEAFHEWVWPYASAVLFIRGQIRFHHLNGDRAQQTTGSPSVLIAYTPQAAERLASQTVLEGPVVRLHHRS